MNYSELPPHIKKAEDKINKKAKRVDDRTKSKFSEKYHERIRSIQTSEKKREQNIRRLERNK